MEKKRNLWVIPTDKPSRLHKYDFDGFALSKEALNWKEAKNIYITSDEYIGLSYYLDGNLIRKGVIDDENYWKVRKEYKKIILTTDQDLIKDGVQAIDDKFLEWLVKNPSCESVETERLEDGQYVDRFADGSVIEGIYENYKIIIPKEEPKQDFVYKCTCLRPQVNCFSGMCSYCNRQIVKNLTTEDLKQKQETLEEVAEEYPKVFSENGDELFFDKQGYLIKEEPKQETLEEFAERLCPNKQVEYDMIIEGAKWQQEQNRITTDDAYNEGFENGKNWQAERMYSEEDLDAFRKFMIQEQNFSKSCLDVFVKQFKKK